MFRCRFGRAVLSETYNKTCFRDRQSNPGPQAASASSAATGSPSTRTSGTKDLGASQFAVSRQVLLIRMSFSLQLHGRSTRLLVLLQLCYCWRWCSLSPDVNQTGTWERTVMVASYCGSTSEAENRVTQKSSFLGSRRTPAA